ncbi:MULTISPECIES: hypothetical protein [Desulfofundulus]|uniref:Uncharacterized protein n=1 Tax=Desulfofundulus thermosubterraneus DSM 16057 TaxID=1121432 RepID=A0A1M6KLM1_9FIRM|nr:MULTISPECIES: hypothetical protein [Desulfofundulus]NHM25439.1 hypothetical protein [Desulfofundulus sp. TPOSR]NHM27028.1 hypothetical protein [Desulfofundulus sp. TPOSR]SHJ59790.1 hypothetical protein SAMN02745219_02912 [Desulfofundulus thermosubterraneus DSM 16057]
MEVSKHALKRWRERVNPDAGPERAQSEMLKGLEQAIRVYDELDNAYFIKDNILFIVKDEVVVTVVNLDFGFSEDINRVICRMQTERLLELKKKLEEAQEQAQQHISAINDRLAVLDSEKAEVEARLQEICSKRRKLELAREEVEKGLEALRKQYAAEFSKLKYSLDFRLETVRKNA